MVRSYLSHMLFTSAWKSPLLVGARGVQFFRSMNTSVNTHSGHPSYHPIKLSDIGLLALASEIMPNIPRPIIHLNPINWVQRVALYVTTSRYYLIGSNNTQTAFKVLKIDRTDPHDELNIFDDRYEYNYQEICDLLLRLDSGNKTRSDQSGIKKTVSSFGLLGFVRFLHGYYLILVLKRRKVASIGYHTIYKVEDTKMIYIPNEQPKELIDEEARFVRAFTRIDLSSNFYFSYSYDLSQTLQYNLSPVRPSRVIPEVRRIVHRNSEGRVKYSAETAPSKSEQKPSGADKPMSHYLIKNKPHDRFVWNSHLVDIPHLHDDWKLNLIHGFVAQANISVFNKPIYITLVARRSRRYCGTRFLKRGLNLDGDVANEVETEQIVHDASISSFSSGFYTSFVQMRGSLPERWSQDTTKLVAKPPIMQDFVDPYHQATARHFDNLLQRYGTPIVVLNLIKHNEKKPHESILLGMLNSSVDYLNQFLPPQHVIKLIAFDMARCNKAHNENVMKRLGKIGFNIVRVVGIFQSWTSARKSNYDNTYTMHLRQRTFNRMPSSSRIGGYRLRTGQCLQNGVVRVNCVDSLDRTNTAQFALGKVALAFQLQALGVLIEPSLKYDTDAVRLLEQLYEDHGDTIALQYGGSQLVHRVKTYRKIAPITSHSREIMQTLSRYYSNTFSDAEKQSVISLFLGVRKANPQDFASSKDVYDMISDYYLHNASLLKPFRLINRDKSYTRWWDRSLLKSLPRSYHEYEKEATCYLLELRGETPTLEERVDYFLDAYKPYELTCLSTLFHLQILNTIRDFMPYGAVNYSPFCLRLGPGKLREKYLKLPSNRRLPPNPSVYGLPSNSSSSSDISILDEEDLSVQDDQSEILSNQPTTVNFTSSIDGLDRTRTENYTLMRYLTEEDVASIHREESSQIFHEVSSTMDANDLALYLEYHMIGRTLNLSQSNEQFNPSREIHEYVQSCTLNDLSCSPSVVKLGESTSGDIIPPPNTTCQRWNPDHITYSDYANFVQSC